MTVAWQVKESTNHKNTLDNISLLLLFVAYLAVVVFLCVFFFNHTMVQFSSVLLEITVT